MKNHTTGWAKAIAETNARIEADTEALDRQEASSPKSENEHDAVAEMRKRCATIAGACAEAGMSGHAIAYFDDPRDLDEILAEIRAVHLTADFASHLGLDSEFTPKAH